MNTHNTNNTNINTDDLTFLEEKFGFKIMAALSDDDISEILINPDGALIVKSDHQKYNLGSANIPQFSEAINLLRQNSNTALDSETPDCLLNLPDIEPYRNAQVKVLIPPLSTAFSATIQKRKRTIFSLKSYAYWHLVSQKGHDFLRDALHSYQNIIISGTQKSGKTALLNALLNEVSQKDRVLIAEESPELRASIDDLIYLKCTPTRNMQHLIQNSLNMHPDRLIVGEIKPNDVSTLLKAWPLKSFGSGGLTSFCAESIEETLKQFQAALLLSNPDMSETDAIKQILNTVDVLAHMTKGSEMDAKPHITHLVRLIRYDTTVHKFIFETYVDPAECPLKMTELLTHEVA